MDWAFGDPALVDERVALPSPFAPVVNGQKRLPRQSQEDVPPGKRCRTETPPFHQFAPMGMQLDPTMASPFGEPGMMCGAPFFAPPPQQTAPMPPQATVTQPPADAMVMGARRCPPCFAHRFCRGSQCTVQVPMPLSNVAHSLSEQQQQHEAMQL